MSQKLSIKGFKWVKKLSKFNESFIKGYDEDNNKGYFLEVDVEYPKKVFSRAALNGVALNLHSNLPFLPERKKIKKCIRLVYNIQDKENYVVQIRALNHGLILIKVHRVTQFNQKAWLKPYIHMNTEFRKEEKNDFEKDFLKVINNAVLGEKWRM